METEQGRRDAAKTRRAVSRARAGVDERQRKADLRVGLGGLGLAAAGMGTLAVASRRPSWVAARAARRSAGKQGKAAVGELDRAAFGKSLSEISKLSPAQWARVERMAATGGKFEGRSSSVAQARRRQSVKARAKKLVEARDRKRVADSVSPPEFSVKHFPKASRTVARYEDRVRRGLKATPPSDRRRVGMVYNQLSPEQIARNGGRQQVDRVQFRDWDLYRQAGRSY